MTQQFNGIRIVEVLVEKGELVAVGLIAKAALNCRTR
jgi:hypothetical protein